MNWLLEGNTEAESRPRPEEGRVQGLWRGAIPLRPNSVLLLSVLGAVSLFGSVPGAEAQNSPSWTDQFSKELSLGSEKPSGPEEPSIEKIRAIAGKSVVEVVSFDANGVPISAGTGFYFKEKLVATNLHIVRRASSLSFRVPGGDAIVGPARIKGRSEALNIALVEAPHEVPPLKPAAKDAQRIGTPILILGGLDGDQLAGSNGEISHIQSFEGARRYRVTARVSPESSGGPVFDATGNVVGMATFSLKGNRHEYLVAPIGALSRLAKIHPEAARPVAKAKKKEDIKDDIELDKYSKTLHSSKEFISIRNKTKNTIKDISFLLTYKDMNGITIRSRKLKMTGPIPAGVARTETYATPDKLRPYEYIDGQVVLGNDLYDVQMLPLEYELASD